MMVAVITNPYHHLFYSVVLSTTTTFHLSQYTVRSMDT